MNMVRAVAAKNLINSSIEACKGVRPPIVCLAHQLLVEFSIILLEPAAQYMHTIASIIACQAGESKIAGSGQVVDRSAASLKVKAFGIEMHMAHILQRISAAGSKPGGVLTGIAEIPDTKVGMIMAYIGEEYRRLR